MTWLGIAKALGMNSWLNSRNGGILEEAVGRVWRVYYGEVVGQRLLTLPDLPGLLPTTQDMVEVPRRVMM